MMITILIEYRGVNMGLIELREYIQTQGKVSLKDICIHFDKTPEDIYPMLVKWIKKGQLLEEDISIHKCNGCTSCDRTQNVFYSWNLLN